MVIPGCSSAHVISFYSDGSTFRKWKTILDFLEDGNQQDPRPDQTVDDLEEDEEQQDELPMWHESIADIDLFSMIDIGSFIAIRSERGELFHLMKVEEKNAVSGFMDSSENHSTLAGEPFLVCKWYSFQKESKKFAWFSPQPDRLEKAVVHKGEVFSIDIIVNASNQMDINDYRMLVCNAH